VCLRYGWGSCLLFIATAIYVFYLLSSRVVIASRAPAAISPIIVGVVILSSIVVSALVSVWVAVTGFSTVLSSVSVTVFSMDIDMGIMVVDRIVV